MRFANFRQITLLSLGWVLLLFVVDYVENPRPLLQAFDARANAPVAASRPHLTLWMNHLCCSGCRDDVREALKTIPGLGDADVARPTDLPDVEKMAAATTASETGYANRIEVDVTDLRAVDFVALDHALEKTGLVAEQLELSGVPHFRLEAQLNHICCRACSKALESGFDIAKSIRATGRFRWIDSISVSKERRTVVAHARYNATADVEELMGVLHRLGFAPSALRILVGSES
jgi:copper chaperone CopZ